MKTIRVLLADDHTLFRKGLASLLEKEKCFEIMGEAENGAEAIARAPKNSQTTAAADLTEREKEVLQLLAAGLTNKEIGTRLDIAENTVKNHLKNILAKLHLQNRVQAAALAIQQGLVTVKSSLE